MRTESIPFSDIPSQSKLFLDYLNDPVSLRNFYPTAVASHTDLAGRVGEVVDTYQTDRPALCAALRRINLSYSASTQTLDNIELLSKPGTVAVLTGQQTGLLTGPLYSVYKALSAIKMAECLRGRGIDAVPVFWMATEDHDFAEISNAFAIGSEDKLLEARMHARSESEGRPVGAIPLDAEASAQVAALLSQLPESEYSDQLRRDAATAWKAGRDIAGAFGTMLTSMLGRYGLIIVDPADAEIKQLASPAYARSIRKSGEIVQAIVARGAELASAGYHSQVLVEKDYFPMFYHADDGRRLALRRAEDGRLRVKGERASFEETELAELAAAEPERFSPGVMLRPVVQDILFPTICYFGGGAEIAYFAQNSEAYRVMGRAATPILHRQSFTVIEPKHARTMGKYDLILKDLLSGRDHVIRRVLDDHIDPAMPRLFADVEERINTELHRLDQSMSALDVALAANLATRRRKVIYHIGALREKYYRRRAVTDETISRRVNAALDSLTPHGGLQERTLNVVSFLARYGNGFIDWVYDSVDLDDRGHRVLYL